MNDIKQRMIQQAVVLLAQKGLQGTSFSELLLASGAPRGSLYHHFPGGKAELVLAAVDAAGRLALDFLDTLKSKSAAEVVEGFVGLWRHVLISSDFGAGCAVLAVTVAADSPALLQGAAKVFGVWRLKLGDLLIEGGVPPRQASALSVLMISACEGALALSRAEKSIEPLELVAGQLRAVVESATQTA